MACSKSKRCAGSKTQLNAAELKHRIEFQKTTQTSDGAGGWTESWTTIATVWAKIEPVKSYERFIAMQTETYTTHKITCRYNANITTAKRALFNGRLFDVTGVINVEEDNSVLHIMATEGSL